MTPLSIAYVATAAVCAIVAVQHMIVASRVPDRKLHLLFALAPLGLLTVVLDFTVGITYVGPVEIRSMELLWGEEISQGVGPTNPLRAIADFVLVGFLLVFLDTTIRLIRRGERRSARVMGGSLVVCSLGAWAESKGRGFKSEVPLLTLGGLNDGKESEMRIRSWPSSRTTRSGEARGSARPNHGHDNSRPVQPLGNRKIGRV